MQRKPAAEFLTKCVFGGSLRAVIFNNQKAETKRVRFLPNAKRAGEGASPARVGKAEDHFGAAG